MLKLWTKMKTWKVDEDGATAIEYGLIAAGIAVAIAAVVFAFGEELVGLFEGLTDTLSGAGGGGE
ncbi:MAG: Flp family type IVb pilin [Pseudomonadota bacterium]|jgi:pilus assembly protein Flp/PilA|nr:Flp family type IVb pilin [Pseudomonadota bacterium]QKK05024.1 MAG: Flp family type IVb pilin [Pseudomonadota bacterium]